MSDLPKPPAGYPSWIERAFDNPTLTTQEREAAHAEVTRLRETCRKLAYRAIGVAAFYDDLTESPDGAVPAWDLLDLALHDVGDALRLTRDDLEKEPPA